MLIDGYFTWLFRNVSKTPEIKFLSNEARSLYDAVMNARKDFDKTKKGQTMNRYLKAKHAFMDTDILRWCSVAHGMIQHVGTHNSQEPRTREMGLFPLMYAIHAWLRQIQLHAAYYKWWAEMNKKRRAMAGEKKLSDMMEEEGSIGVIAAELTIPDYVAQQILVTVRPGSCVSSSQIRNALRNKAKLKGMEKFATLIQDKIKHLEAAGLLKPVADDDVRFVIAPEDDAEDEDKEVEASAKAKPGTKGKAKATPKKRGPKVKRFEKSSWIEVSGNRRALEMVARLQLTADDFNAH